MLGVFGVESWIVSLFTCLFLNLFWAPNGNAENRSGQIFHLIFLLSTHSASSRHAKAATHSESRLLVASFALRAGGLQRAALSIPRFV